MTKSRPNAADRRMARGRGHEVVGRGAAGGRCRLMLLISCISRDSMFCDRRCDAAATTQLHQQRSARRRTAPTPTSAGDDDVQRVELAAVVLVGRCDLRTPKNDQATARIVRSSEPLRGRGAAVVGCGSRARPVRPRRRGRRRLGGVLPPTSKKVYDSVIVVTSFGSFGSITNTTGHCFVSPGSSVYCVEAEALELVEVRRRLLRRIARDRLRRHACGPARCGTRTSPSPARPDAPASSAAPA